MPFHLIFFIAWELVENKVVCDDPDEFKVGSYLSIEHCAAGCYGRASMFNYGTNEFGKQRCWKINQCECWCMPSTSIDGVCDVTRIPLGGYRLFKLASKGRCFIALNVTGSLSEANLDHISTEKFTEFSLEFS